jgi:hypothetical protein
MNQSIQSRQKAPSQGSQYQVESPSYLGHYIASKPGERVSWANGSLTSPYNPLPAQSPGKSWTCPTGSNLALWQSAVQPIDLISCPKATYSTVTDLWLDSIDGCISFPQERLSCLTTWDDCGTDAMLVFVPIFRCWGGFDQVRVWTSGSASIVQVFSRI